MIERLINAKSLMAMKVALLASPFMFWVEKYIFDDWEFLRWVVILIVLDLVWALRLAWRQKNLSLKGFEKSGEKLAQYATLLVLGHILLHVRSDNEPIAVLSYFTLLIHIYILSREAISILEKQVLINPKYVPNWLLERLRAFHESGDTDKLTQLRRDEKKPED